MSSATDNVRPSTVPNAWRIDNLTIAGIILGLGNLIFCTAILAIGKYRFGFDLGALRTLAAVVTVFGGQAVFYAVRERRHLWSSCPSPLVMISSVIDVLSISVLATRGVPMVALPVSLILAVLGGAIALAFVLDMFRAAIFHRLEMA